MSIDVLQTALDNAASAGRATQGVHAGRVSEIIGAGVDKLASDLAQEHEVSVQPSLSQGVGFGRG